MRYRMGEHSRFDAHDIDITVSNGVVRLTGMVANRWGKRLEEDVPARVPWLKDIDNHLTHQPVH